MVNRSDFLCRRPNGAYNAVVICARSITDTEREYLENCFKGVIYHYAPDYAGITIACTPSGLDFAIVIPNPDDLFPEHLLRLGASEREVYFFRDGELTLICFGKVGI